MDSDNVTKSLCSPFQKALLPKEAAFLKPFSYSQPGDCPTAGRIIAQRPWQLGLVISLPFLLVAGHTTWRLRKVWTFGQDSSLGASLDIYGPVGYTPHLAGACCVDMIVAGLRLFFFFYPYSVLFSNKRNSETFKFCEISNLSIMHLLCAPLQPLPPPWAGNQCWFPTPGYQALEASRGQLCAGTRPSSANKEQLTHCSQSSSQCKTLWARHKLPPLSSGTLTL